MHQASATRQMRFVQAVAWTLILAVAMGLNISKASANPRYAAYVLDTNTGQVLFSRNADHRRFPASLTKMMTLYLVFEALDADRISKNTKVPISANAASEPPSKIGVRSGSSVTVEQIILSLVTKSANDMATAIAEFLGGSEANFALMMTNKARQLGMNSTTFRNAHGLPNSQQVTTARDMAILGLAIREHFPDHYAYFNARQFNFGKQRFGNHNRLLGRVDGVDGIKTGYIRASGFNLVTSVRTGGRSVVAVVMGGQSGARRDAHMADLIREHLPHASNHRSNPILIARTPFTRGKAPQSAAAFALPERVQAPKFRPALSLDASVQTQTAHGPSLPMRPSSSSAVHSKTIVSDGASRASYAPVPERFAPPMPVKSPSMVERSELVDPMATSSTAPASGWAVQVASVGSRSEAMQVLGRIMDTAGQVLAGAQPFTVPFTRNGTIYVRARFGGFATNSEAWKVCDALKRQKIDCFAEQL